MFWCMLCTATPDIWSSSENMNSTARVSRLSFRVLWLWKNKICYVSLPIPYIWSPLSRGNLIITRMNSYCYCLMPLKNGGSTYNVVLSALAKLRNAQEASNHPAFMASTCSHMSYPYHLREWLVISLFQVVCRGWDAVAPGEYQIWRMWTWNLCR